MAAPRAGRLLEASLEPTARSAGAGPKRKPKVRGSGRLLPARLGEYELFDHIGRGGMADIYRARKPAEFGVVRQVVVKEILPELAESERLSDLLAEEARTASRLEHANVVRIEDLQRDDDTLFIAMEYVEGVDLRELLRGRSRGRIELPLEIALRIVLEVLRALDYAHGFRFRDPGGSERVGVIHRDVSPSNILLSFDGEVKLCDFGIAKSYDSCDSEDDLATGVFAGMVEGKAGYMSPEQARGEALDGRADVFAAGIVLWELCAGRKLYKPGPGESLFDVARRGMVPPLPERGLPNEPKLRAILQRALAWDRRDRWESAAELSSELLRYAQPLGLRPSAIKLRQFLRQHFEPNHRSSRQRRELATRALATGPVVQLSVVATPPPDAAPPPALDPMHVAQAPIVPVRAPSGLRLALLVLTVLCLIASAVIALR